MKGDVPLNMQYRCTSVERQQDNLE